MEEEFIRDMARWIAMTVHERMEKEGELNEQKRETILLQTRTSSM